MVMFRTLIQIFRTKNYLQDIKEEFYQMIKDTEWMYRTVTGVLLGKTEPEEIKQDIYARDREVNKRERAIRRSVVNHLSLQPKPDVPACLVFMSVVKDVERIGDYCKNIFEIAEIYTIPSAHARYAVTLTEISEKVGNLFGKTEEAFRNSDEKMAIEVLSDQNIIAKECDLLIKQLINDTLPTNEAVASALISRYLKRVVRHLANITSSIVSTVENIDYYPRKKEEPNLESDSGQRQGKDS